MILVTGPAGPGKTTSLYAPLQLLQSPSLNIVTTKHQVEYRFAVITQAAIRKWREWDPRQSIRQQANFSE